MSSGLTCEVGRAGVRIFGVQIREWNLRYELVFPKAPYSCRSWVISSSATQWRSHTLRGGACSKVGSGQGTMFLSSRPEVSGPLMWDTYPADLLASKLLSHHHFSKLPPLPEEQVFVLTSPVSMRVSTGSPRDVCSDEPAVRLLTPQYWLVASSQPTDSHTVVWRCSSCLKWRGLRHEGEIMGHLLLPGPFLPQT